MIHHYNHETLVVLVIFTVSFYHFLFSRYLELAERHFSSVILVPFPDSGVLCNRGMAKIKSVWHFVTLIHFWVIIHNERLIHDERLGICGHEITHKSYNLLWMYMLRSIKDVRYKFFVY